MQNQINLRKKPLSLLIATLSTIAFAVSISANASENCELQRGSSQTVDELNINLNLISSDQKDLEKQLNKCDDSRIDLRKVRPGYQCLTTKGAIFTRVDEPLFGESWKSETGLVWSSPRGSGDHFHAISLCKKIGGRLPRSQEILLETKLGLHEVASGMIPSREQEVYKKFRAFELVGGGSPLENQESVVLYVQRQKPLPTSPSLGRDNSSSSLPEIICVK